MTCNPLFVGNRDWNELERARTEAMVKFRAMKSEIRPKHYLVRGRVQGVGYRWFALRSAERFGIRGYARNLSNGDVEVRAEAEEFLLESFKEELRRGPHAAWVSEVIEQDLPVTSTYTSFSIG